jgi:predicted nuclease with TOPRIM domain
LFRHKGSFQLKLPQIRGAVSGAWPDLIESIKQEAAEPLKKYITELQEWLEQDQQRLDDAEADCKDLEDKNDHLTETCNAHEQALKDKDEECRALLAKVNRLTGRLEVFEAQESQTRDSRGEPPLKRARGRPMPLSSPYYSPRGTSKAIPIVIDDPPPSQEQADASSSRGASSLGKHP